MGTVVFDIELAGAENEGPMHRVVVHHEMFGENSFPLTHILNVAADELGWPKPWLELRSQQSSDVLATLQYEKQENSIWEQTCCYGQIPESGTRVDLYVLDHKPNSTIDMLLDV